MIREYFNNIADILDATSKSASIGGHRPDSGANREVLLIDFLNKHIPDRLTAVSGGTIVNLHGQRSKQIDIVVKNDLYPQLNSHGKTCILTENVAAVLSVKSHLDKNALHEAIENVASIPESSDNTLSLTNSSIVRTGLQDNFAKNWPLRAIFSYDGIDPDTIYKHTLDYYKTNSARIGQFPSMIVVNRKLCIRFLPDGGELMDGTKLPPNYLNPLSLKPETQGYPLAGLITQINDYVPWMHYMKTQTF